MKSTRSHAEAKVEAYTLIADDDKTKRLLQAVIEHAPGDRQRAAVCEAINACQNDQALRNLSKVFLSDLLIPCKQFVVLLRPLA